MVLIVAVERHRGLQSTDIFIFKYNFTNQGKAWKSCPEVDLTLLCFSITPVNNYARNKQQIFFPLGE